MEKTIEIQKKEFDGLCYVNLVDGDMIYGHRRDIAGYAGALTQLMTAGESLRICEMMIC